jgi:hypothetical protein
MVKRWDYDKREGDRAFCELCDGDGNNEYTCVGVTTGSLIRHLESVHGVKPPQESIKKRYVINKIYF